MNTESPLEAICRRAREHREAILADPDSYSREEVERAKLDAYQSARLSPASILRYD